MDKGDTRTREGKGREGMRGGGRNAKVGRREREWTAGHGAMKGLKWCQHSTPDMH